MADCKITWSRQDGCWRAVLHYETGVSLDTCHGDAPLSVEDCVRIETCLRDVEAVLDAGNVQLVRMFEDKLAEIAARREAQKGSE